MVKVTYVEPGGAAHVVDVPVGVSLMRGAVDNGVPGIVGECGGQMACGTCHCFVGEHWLGLSGARSAFEEGMLALSEHTRPTSRLACQIKASEDLEGLVLHTPPSQP